MAKRKRQPNPLGVFVRKARLERGWNQEQLAAVTFSTRYVRAVEKGSCLPSPLALQVLANHLDMSPDILLDLRNRQMRSRITPPEQDIVAVEEDARFQLDYANTLIHKGQQNHSLETIREAEEYAKPYAEYLSVYVRYRIPYLRGMAYLQLGQTEQAGYALEQALELARGDQEALAWVGNMLGVAFYVDEKPVKALEQHWSCLRLAQAGVVKDPNLRLSIYRNLANDYWALNRLSDAIRMYKEATNILKDLDAKPRSAGVYWGMALAYHGIGDVEQAKVNGLKALQIYEELGDESSSAMICNNLAEVFIAEGELGDAERFLDRAQALVAASQDHALLSTYHRSRADLARWRSDWERALFHVKESIHFGKELYCKEASSEADVMNTAGTARTGGSPGNANSRRGLHAARVYAQACHMAALIEEAMGHVGPADELFMQALALIEKTGFEETRSVINKDYATALLARGRYERANAYYSVAVDLRRRAVR